MKGVFFIPHPSSLILTRTDWPPGKETAMRWSLAWMFGLALAVAAVGCRSCDRVEAELRARDRELRNLKDELDRTKAYANGLQAELNVEHGLAPPAWTDPAVTPYPVRSLVLGKQTAGLENNYGSGDQALQVVVEPHDAEDQAVKVPGTLVVQALEITPEGAKKPLSTWEVSADHVRRSWHSGLLSTGYTIVLPWKTCPTTEKLRVVVQFKLPDGRMFEADKDIAIHLPPPGSRPMPPSPDLAPVPQADETILPAPRRAEPPEGGPSISNHSSTYLQPVQMEKPDAGQKPPVWRVVEPRQTPPE
jgi:hypothetical protein